MSRQIYCRVLGYLLTIALHVGNLISMDKPVPEEVKDDYRVKGFTQLKYRYMTVWTFMLQTVFATSGLCCDLLTLYNSSQKDYRLPKYLKGFRDTLFCGIVYPSVILVFSFFWTVYLYDRSLVYPKFLDKLLTPANNHIMHTAILPLLLWEVWFQPRKMPNLKAHVRFLAHGLFYASLYLSVIFYTYVTTGIWVYPIIRSIYGTIYFPIFFVSMVLYGVILYGSHWVLVYCLWRNLEKPKRKIR